MPRGETDTAGNDELVLIRLVCATMTMLNSHRRMPQERRIGMRGYNHLTPSSL